MFVNFSGLNVQNNVIDVVDVYSDLLGDASYQLKVVSFMLVISHVLLFWVLDRFKNRLDFVYVIENDYKDLDVNPYFMIKEFLITINLLCSLFLLNVLLHI